MNIHAQFQNSSILASLCSRAARYKSSQSETLKCQKYIKIPTEETDYFPQIMRS